MNAKVALEHASIVAQQLARQAGATEIRANATRMCGRFGFSSSPQRVARRFNVAVPESVAAPRFNVAPTQNVLAITNRDPHTVTELRWGLVPFWATDPATMKLTTFNARIETIATARMYGEPLRSKRCAILASGFYEWRRNGDGKKTPMWISRRDEEPFVFAGLWDHWRRGDTALNSCTIVTQPPNELLAPIHSRMPLFSTTTPSSSG